MTHDESVPLLPVDMWRHDEQAINPSAKRTDLPAPICALPPLKVASEPLWSQRRTHEIVQRNYL